MCRLCFSFSIPESQYDVALFEPKASGFAPRPREDDLFQTAEVEIATMRAPGPRPVAHSPPTYSEETDGPSVA